jgi:coenzyme F420-0:L-glutamate ligase/coenzyme F420-1:gamma-L-glutamate ligase
VSVELFALEGFPLVRPGDDLAALVLARCTPRADDVLVLAQKIVSKAEGREVALADVMPSVRAEALARDTAKDARIVELILRESVRVVRARENLIIAQHRLGHIMANAGIDQSNIAPGEHERALLLPLDPDATAAALHARLGCAVVISDSFGRPWRRGTMGVAIGCAGLPAVVDLRGQPDLFGRPLHVTLTGFADEIAAAAGLVMGQAAEGVPAVLVRGLRWHVASTPASELVRPAGEDLFR